MDRYHNRQAMRTASQIASIGQTRYGILTSFDPVRHLGRVTLQPEGVLTGWLEMGTSMPGWQMVPPLGGQVVVLPREGDSANGIIVAHVYSTPNPPPQSPNALGTGGTPSTSNAPMVSGETLFKGPSGAVLRVCADGSVYIAGPVNIDGPLHVNGDITSTSGDVYDKHGSLDRLRGKYDLHGHTGVVSGGATTGLTTLPDPE